MRIWVRILLALAIVCLASAIGGAFLHKFGMTPFGVSSTLVMTAFALSVLVAVAAVVSLFVAIVKRQPYGIFTMFVAFLICFGLAGYAAILYNKSTTYPFVHNISTDLEDPPMFSSALLARRGETSNPVEIDDGTKELHQGAYDDIKSLVLHTDLSFTFTTALELVEDRGWEIVTQDSQAGSIEATASTFWFGFKDDVAIRLRSNSETGTTTVDMHSVSRFGGSDLGANAARIRAFFKDLQTKVS